MTCTYYVNGKYLSPNEAKISVNDLGFTRGIGVFEYIRVYQGVPFALDRHLERLKNSCKELGLEYPTEDLREIASSLIGASETKELYLRIYVSGGTEGGPQTLSIGVDPFVPFSEHFYEKGVSLLTTLQQRAFCRCKTTFYLPAHLALQQAHKKGYDDALYLDTKNHILELTKSNIFVVIDETLITPVEDILWGTTREIVLECAHALGMQIELRKIGFWEIPKCDEAFQTSSSKEVMPICQINKHTIPLGPLTKQLLSAYQERIQETLLMGCTR